MKTQVNIGIRLQVWRDFVIRGRLEGRFFQKEYIFDKSGDEGRGVFCPSLSTPPGLYLNHVCEVMNETEYLW